MRRPHSPPSSRALIGRLAGAGPGLGPGGCRQHGGSRRGAFSRACGRGGSRPGLGTWLVGGGRSPFLRWTISSVVGCYHEVESEHLAAGEEGGPCTLHLGACAQVPRVDEIRGAAAFDSLGAADPGAGVCHAAQLAGRCRQVYLHCAGCREVAGPARRHRRELHGGRCEPLPHRSRRPHLGGDRGHDCRRRPSCFCSFMVLSFPQVATDYPHEAAY
nr:alpha/beta-tubulin-N-acetyltransferase 9 isoform X7 [Pan troglodytes]